MHFFKKFHSFIYLEREGDRDGEEADGERDSQADSLLSIALRLRTPRSWPGSKSRVRRLTHWALQAPPAQCLFITFWTTSRSKQGTFPASVQLPQVSSQWILPTRDHRPNVCLLQSVLLVFELEISGVCHLLSMRSERWASAVAHSCGVSLSCRILSSRLVTPFSLLLRTLGLCPDWDHYELGYYGYSPMGLFVSLSTHFSWVNIQEWKCWVLSYLNT